MKFRFLDPTEVPKVEGVFRELDCEPPKNGRIWVGEENGEIVSLQCLHYVPHMGPVWIRPDYRGKGLWAKMQGALEKILPKGFGFYQFGTAKNISQLRRLGMTPLGWLVWVKRVE